MKKRTNVLALVAALLSVFLTAPAATAAGVSIAELTATDDVEGVVALGARGAEWHYPKDRSNPFVAKSPKDLVEGLGAEVARKVQPKVDFKKQHVLIFRWQNSGSDNFQVKKPKKKGEAVQFHLSRGNTKASIADIRCYAVPIELKWHFSSVSRDRERIRIAE